MAPRKKKSVEVTVPEEKEVINMIPTPEMHFCDLHIICQKCGSDQTIGKGLEGGLQLVIVPKEDSFIQLTCDKCDASLRLILVPGEAPEPTASVEIKEETKIDEDVPQENKQEESL
jgi:hypothetical protein